jgi:hypothetical protein
MAADQLGAGGPLDRAHARWPVHARINRLVTDNCSRIHLRVGIPLCGGLHLRGAIPGVCKHCSDGAAYAGVRRSVRLGHDSIAMASYATRAWPRNLRVESAKAELGAVAESDHPYCFWIGALLFLSSIKCVGIGGVHPRAQSRERRARRLTNRKARRQESHVHLLHKDITLDSPVRSRRR